MRIRFALAMASLVGTLTVAAQQPPPPVPPAPTAPGVVPQRLPPRDTRGGDTPQKGTAVLRGVVTSASTGGPLRRAMVRVFSQDGRGGGVVSTDADGRFEVKDLPAGRYTVNASKAGYVAVSYGQRQPEQPGTVLDVKDGQTIEKIALTMPRGGVITGRVVDEFGEPIAGAQVSPMRYRFGPGGRRMMATGGGTTDDLGAFRLYGLMPGDYYVAASVRSAQQMMTMNGVSTAAAAADGFAPTYFPGTPNPAEANRISVRAGGETTNISFALSPARLSRISGRALSSSGEPVVQAFVSLMPANGMVGGMFMGGGGGMTNPDGSFQLVGVVPGNYVLMLQRRNNDPQSEFATLRITVGEGDIDNVLLVSSRGGIARGVIITDDGSPLPLRPEQANVVSRSADPEMFTPGAQGKVNVDWSFELTGLSDRLMLAAFLPSADWTLKAILLNGVDVTDTPMEFTPGQTVDGFEVVFSRKRTELSGAITGEGNVPETDATVIIFPEDASKWTWGTRFVRTARPSQDGRYTLRGMPPHDYLVAVVKNIEQGQWQDPEYLETLREQAVRVSFNEGESKVLDLTIAR